MSAAVAGAALAAPGNQTIEIAGPEAFPLDELLRQYLRAKKDERQVITDSNAGYFGLPITDQTLTPGDDPQIGPTRFDAWLTKSAGPSTASRARRSPSSAS